MIQLFRRKRVTTVDADAPGYPVDVDLRGRRMIWTQPSLDETHARIGILAGLRRRSARELPELPINLAGELRDALEQEP